MIKKQYEERNPWANSLLMVELLNLKKHHENLLNRVYALDASNDQMRGSENISNDLCSTVLI